jgi:hypothetical protein
MNVTEIRSKLNTRSADYVAGIGISQDVLAELGVRGFVAFDAKNKRVSGYRPVEKADESAFDKVVWQYDDEQLRRGMLDLLYRMTDNNGYVLVLGIRNYSWLLDEIDRRNLSVSDSWVFGTDNNEVKDVYFRVKKDAV